jgi:hypothetical protein
MHTVVIFDYLSYMTTVSRQPTLLHQPFEFKYALTNQHLGSNEIAVVEPGTKLEYILNEALDILA